MHGQRVRCIGVAIALIASALVAVPAGGATTAAATTANAGGHANDWPQHYRGPHHRAVDGSETVLSPATVAGLHPVWSAGDGNDYGRGDPIVAGGSVYIVLAGRTHPTMLESLDATTGAVRWTRAGRFRGTPALVGHRLIVAYESSTDQTEPAGVAAYNANSGRLLWSTPVPIVFDITVTRDVVYAAGADFANRVDALDVHTGAVLWRFASGVVAEATAPAVGNGVVYVGESSGDDGDVRALDAHTGSTLWVTRSAAAASVSITPDRVFVGTWKKTVEAFDRATGTRLWKRGVGGLVFTVPAVLGDLLYAGATDGRMNALDVRTGGIVWRYQAGIAVRGSAAVANGVVYFGAFDGDVYAVDAKTGAGLWSATINGDIGAPVVANGMLYVARGSNTASGPPLVAYSTAP